LSTDCGLKQANRPAQDEVRPDKISKKKFFCLTAEKLNRKIEK
jgi:hypothetical protein